MKRRQAIGVTASTLAGAAVLPWPAAAAPAQPGELVAWPEVRLLDGTTWGSADAQHKAVVAVFWSVTCPFCQRHNTHLEKLRQQAAGRALTILTVARERDPRAVQQKLAQQGWQFAVTLDAAPMSLALSPRRLVPLTVTVDRQGRLVQVIPGEMFEEDVLAFLRLAA